MRLLAACCGPQTGIDNMALDEALLEWVRAESQATLLIRTYRWQVPTLSLGVHQKVGDLDFLLRFYGQGQPVEAVVRRPTGGRAILHGQDISFAFITNHPALLRLSLKDAYAQLTDLLRQGLSAVGVPTQMADQAGGRDYLSSPVCFQTHTPSDLLALDGRKLCGSAQLRRAGGLLQHGSAFVTSPEIEEAAFLGALRQSVQAHFGLPVEVLSVAELLTLLSDWPAWRSRYESSSKAIWERASTTTGSHLLPASC